MAADDYLLSILAVFKDMASGDLKKFGTAVLGTGKTIDKTGKQVSSFGNKLTVLSAKFVSIRTAANQAGEMFQKAFDFAELGAQSLQTTAAFDSLLDTLDAAPNTLDQLRSASRNTISELDLMASTSTLLAGAQGELATALAGSTPKLMEIAKAANALNPSLGDTNFLYQSLATGIKRASPMILDNLGLMIKIGDANEKYAASLGKSVEALTAEEKQIALLNETLRAGNVLIDQAGDNIDSVTDDFARFEAALKNAKIALGEMVVPILAPLLEQITDLFIITEKEAEAMDRAEEAAGRLAKTSKEYAEIVRERLIVEGIMAGSSRAAMEDRLAVMKDGNIAILGFYGQSIKLQQEFVGAYIRTNKRLGLSTKELEKRYDELTEQLDGAGAATIELGWAETELGTAQKEQRDELEALLQTVDYWGDVTNTNVIGAQRAVIALKDWRGEAALLDSQLRQNTGPAIQVVIDQERALELAGERAAYQQTLLRSALSELGIAIRGVVGNQVQGFAEDQAILASKTATARKELGLLEGQLGTMARGTGVGQLEADLQGIVNQMNALGPEPEKLNRAREAVMRDLEWAHWHANAALEEEEKAAGAYGATTAKAAELRAEIAGYERQMSDAQIAHERATDSIVYGLIEQSIAASGMLERAPKRALELQWASAEATGQIDWHTLQTYNSAQRITQLYDENVISLDEAVVLARKLADLAAEPPRDLSLEGREGFYQWSQRDTDDILPGFQAMIDEMDDEFGGVLGTEDDPRKAFIEVGDFPLVKQQGDFLRGTVMQWVGDHHGYFYAHYYTIDEPGAGPGNGGRNGRQPGSPYERYQSGGVVSETGLALVHAGELIIPPMEAQQVQAEGGGGGVTYGETNNFYLNVTSVQEMTSLMQEFEMMRALVG